MPPPFLIFYCLYEPVTWIAYQNGMCGTFFGVDSRFRWRLGLVVGCGTGRKGPGTWTSCWSHRVLPRFHAWLG